MAKLYFRHGAVGSAKTLNLLAVAHNYRQQGKFAVLVKPSLDDRFGKKSIRSRAGLEAEADVLVEEDTDLLTINFEGVHCILVDEVQFIYPHIIDQLRRITIEQDIPVICYGLRTDFRSHLFEGSKRLIEVADSIEEVKSTCFYCNHKAIMNLKYVNDVATVEGPVVDLGSEEKYHPACYKCYESELAKAKQTPLAKPQEELAGV